MRAQFVTINKRSDYRFVSICIGLMTVISGCSKPAPSEVGTQKIPVFPGSKLVEENSMGASVGDLGGSLDDVTISYWKFETTASRDDLVDFYMQKFPGAKQGEDEPESNADTGYTTLWIETNNASISELTIEISDGEFTIGESVKD